MIKTDQSLRIAIAGLGFGESVHIPASLSNKNIELVGLWHPREERLKEACNKNNLHAYDSWKDLVNDSKIDGIILATPPAPRYELALEAIKAGKHLLLEKPTCLNSDEVKELQRNERASKECSPKKFKNSCRLRISSGSSVYASKANN